MWILANDADGYIVGESTPRVNTPDKKRPVRGAFPNVLIFLKEYIFS